MPALDRNRPELFGGEIFLVVGASPEHNLIVSDIGHALLGALRGKGQVYASDMRLFVPATGLCGASDLTLDNPPSLRNPTIIFEVLSEATESYDRGDKFGNYRTIASLCDYVLVAQKRVLVEHFTRQPDGTWNLRELRAGQTLRFGCGEIAVNDMYAQVEAARALSAQPR